METENASDDSGQQIRIIKEDISPVWKKIKVIAEILGLIIIPVLIYYLTETNTEARRKSDEAITKQLKEIDQNFTKKNKERESAERKAEIDKEIGVRYVEISVAILRVKPSNQSKELREWAIAIFKKYSPIPLSTQFIEELKQNPLPRSVSYTMQGGPVVGGSFGYEYEYVHKPNPQ